MKIFRNLLVSGLAMLVIFQTLVGLRTSSIAAPMDALSLGTAGGYSLLAGSALTKGDPSSISGDLTSSAGIFPGVVAPELAALFITSGAGAFENGSAPAGLAQVDLATAISEIQLMTPIRETPLLSNETLTPGIYAAPAGQALAITIGLTLDGGGDPNARFIFRTDSALDIDASISVTLINGAQERNVFWVVGSAVTIGATAHVVGNFLVVSAATVGANTEIRGSLLCQGAVTIGANSSIVFDAVIVPVASPSPPASPSDSPTPSASPMPSPSVTPSDSPSPSASPTASSTPTPSETPRATPSPTPIPPYQPPPEPLPVLTVAPTPVVSPTPEPTPLPTPVETFIPLPTPIASLSPEPSLPIELPPSPTPTPSPSVLLPPLVVTSPPRKPPLVSRPISQTFTTKGISTRFIGPQFLASPLTYFEMVPENKSGADSGSGLRITLHNIEVGSHILVVLAKVNHG